MNNILNSSYTVDSDTYSFITETWKFDSEDELNKFYNIINSTDNNYDMPYSIDEFNLLCKKYNINRVDTMRRPDQSVTILFDLNKE